MDELTIETVRQLCLQQALRWTNHVLQRIMQRGIKQDDVLHVLLTGEIIEQYPDDYPYPSCLVLGETLTKRSVHIVCGWDKQTLWLITAYYPAPEKWSDDFKTRKETKQ